MKIFIILYNYNNKKNTYHFRWDAKKKRHNRSILYDYINDPDSSSPLIYSFYPYFRFDSYHTSLLNYLSGKIIIQLLECIESTWYGILYRVRFYSRGHRSLWMKNPWANQPTSYSLSYNTLWTPHRRTNFARTLSLQGWELYAFIQRELSCSKNWRRHTSFHISSNFISLCSIYLDLHIISWKFRKNKILPTREKLKAVNIILWMNSWYFSTQKKNQVYQIK